MIQNMFGGKNFGMGGNFPQGKRKRLPVHGNFSTAVTQQLAVNTTMVCSS
jgi:hypothetical protein